MKKKGITTWIRKKKVRYAAAGTLCLAAAIGILVLGLGIGSRAADTVNLGTGLSENFEVASDGAYLVESAGQLKNLGLATTGTEDKTFRLKQDLEIGITSAATGTFAGTFDGDGHVPLRYNNDKQKKPLFSRGLSVCRLLFNSFSKLKIDENYKEKRRLFY